MSRTSCILVVAILLVMAPPSQGQEASDEPMLLIDAGMHTSVIGGLGVDRAGQYLVTADVGSVRIWELPGGQLLRTIRLPGALEILALTLSPDGSTVAVAASRPDTMDSIFLFDRATGRLVRRISDVLVYALAISPDGRFLASNGWDGLRILRIADGALMNQDSGYEEGGRPTGVAFSSDGWIATASMNGFLRLYDREFQLVAKQAVPGGGITGNLRFSPDGARIAVGTMDTSRVHVVSSRDLSHLFSPDTTGIDGGFVVVEWSADGQRLYGAVFGKAQGTIPIRRWSDAGQGAFTDLPAASDAIIDIRPTPGGGIAFATADPSFGIYDETGELALYKQAPIAEFRDAPGGLRLSSDGSEVTFGYERSGKAPAWFSLSERRLDVDPDPEILQLSPPQTAAGNLQITGWEGNDEPKVNGRKIELEEFNLSHSVAVAPGGKTFLLGSRFGLTHFDRKGNVLWENKASQVWAVNVSADGRAAVAAVGDGTIRWYRLSDGQELLALFPHPDRKRWVLWTPSGYYDASAGGEDLIGWQVDRSMDQAADFFPASRFRSTFYRPDVVAQVFTSFDESEALRLADVERGRKTHVVELQTVLPPVVEILSPGDSVVSSEVEITIEFDVRSDDPVTAVKTLVDGRPTRGIAVVASEPTSEKRKITVTVPQRDSEIAIVAENRNGASVPAIVRVRWQGETPEFVIKPKLYVLAIGVSEYQTETLALGFPAKDARDFAAALSAQKEGIYRDVVVRAVTDEDATKGNILDALEWIETQVTSKDVAMVLIAGHGVNDSNGQYYYLPADVDIDRLKRTAIAFYEIKNTVSNLAGKVLFFVDTCHAGNVMGTRRGVVDVTSVVNELATAENGVVVFAASTGKQYSLEDAAWGNGAFTKAVVEGLGGLADYQGDGSISINELDLYLSERVKELTGGRQTPTTTKPATVPDFPIAISQ